MSKIKIAQKPETKEAKQISLPQKAQTSNGNHSGANESSASTLRRLNKTYTAARTKKEKDEARKALTLATFNATYESHQKRRA